MAKVSFTKLNKIKNIDPKIQNIDDNEIIISQYLPINEKLGLISAVLTRSQMEDSEFFNPVKLRVFYEIEMLKFYTNINFTEKQLENYDKLYDIIHINNIWESISEKIPDSEKEYIWENILILAEKISNYSNSLVGILKGANTDYNSLDLSLDKIISKMQDKDSIGVLKEIYPYLENT